ncbi:MAG TPA: hypothetical protein VEX41_09505, partial [Candidatus Eisenbacteria bacterium]|nr:hypothetical protein [Candidatus Eisenbacteria bacterium]
MRATVALLVLLVAACSGLAAPPGTTDSVSNSGTAASTETTPCLGPPNPPAPSDEAISAAIALGGCQAGAVAVAGGSVWMVPHLDAVALRIDPATNNVIDRISLGDRGPGAEIDAADDMVWASVSSPSYDYERLVRIDPTTGAIVAWVDAEAGFPVIGAGFVWATGPDGLYRIDPATNTVAAIIETGRCGPITLDGRVFCIGSDEAVEIDPTTDAVRPVAGAPSGSPVQAGDGLIWGVDGTSLWAFNPETLQVAVELQPPPGVAMWSLDAVVLDGTLWVAASSQPGDPFRTSPDRL